MITLNVNTIKKLTHWGKGGILCTLFLLTFGCMSVMAQTDRAHIRKGNRHFRSGAVEQAEVEYSKALTKKDNNPQALYNLACAYMAQNKDSLAASFFEKASNVETSKFRKSKSFHNIGVIYQRHQMYGEAIKAYEQSLRINPNDDGWYEKPKNVIGVLVEPISGKPLQDSSKNTKLVYFLKGTEPQATDPTFDEIFESDES